MLTRNLIGFEGAVYDLKQGTRDFKILLLTMSIEEALPDFTTDLISSFTEIYLLLDFLISASIRALRYSGGELA